METRTLKYVLEIIGIALIFIGVILIVISGMMTYISTGPDPIFVILGAILFPVGVIVVRITMIETEDKSLEIADEEDDEFVF